MVKKCLAIFLLLSTFILGVEPDPELSIKARVSPASIPINHLVQLKVDIVYQNPNLKIDLKLPKLEPYFIIASRSQAKSFTNNNGDIEVKHSFVFQLKPQKEGNVSIPPIKAITPDNTFDTDTIFLTITPASSTPQAQRQQIFSNITQPQDNQNVKLEAIVSTTNIYLGETIRYKLVLLRKRNYWNTINVAFPNFEKSWVKELETKKEEYIINQDGNRYYAYELLHKEIAPLESGDYLIPTASISFSSGPFSPAQEFASNATTINVIALPEGAPSDFNGAVGNFQLSASLEKDSLLINSPNTLSITISGSGNLDQIDELNFEESPDLNIYKSSSKTLPNPQTQENERLIEYIIVPESSGQIQIPDMRLSYFSPSMNTYQTLQTTGLSFKVLGTDNPNDTAPKKLTPSTAINQTPRPYKKSKDLLDWQIPLLLILLVIHSAYLAKRLLTWLQNKTNPNFQHHKALEKQIQNILKKCQNPALTATQLQQLLLDVITFSIQKQVKGLAYKQLERVLKQKNLSEPIVNETLKILQDIDALAFQATNSNNDLITLKKRSINVIKAIKKESLS